jgi:hypothetical protein
MRLRCHRCRHVWNYTGFNEYQASCPHCSTKLGLRKILKQIELENEENNKKKVDAQVCKLGHISMNNMQRSWI